MTVIVSTTGTFAGGVSLGCKGLPARASCSFSPSSSVNPTKDNPVTVTLTISTSGAVAGQTTVTLTADASDFSHKTQTFSLTVQDYALNIVNPVVAVFPGKLGVFIALLTSLKTYPTTDTLLLVSSSLP